MTGLFSNWRKATLKAVKALQKDETTFDAGDDVDRILRAIKRSQLVLLMGDVEDTLTEVTQDGGAAALAQIGIVDDESIVSQVNERAIEYARDRSAEMVGKKWVDGELIDNPNAEWVIDEATRDMLRADVTQAIEEGWSNDRLADAIAENYAFSDQRAETIARTETAFADVQGNLAGYKASGVVAAKQWLAAPDCCDDCQEIDGEVVDLDGVFSDGSDGPPAHPNCFSGDAVVAASGVTTHFERWFEGEVVVVRIAGMDDLTVTPHHPVLTPRGWVAVGALQVGDELLQCLDPSAALACVDPDHDKIVARFKDVPSALLVAGGVASGSVPVSAKDFHGDGVIDTQVDVVRAAGLLQRDAADIGKCRKCGALLSTEPGSSERDFAGLGGSSEYLIASDATANGSMRSAGLEALRLEQAFNDLCGNAQIAADRIDRLAAHVSAVKVEDVFRRHFVGTIHNVETSVGWYCANGVIAHNCRCNMVPVLEPLDDTDD